MCSKPVDSHCRDIHAHNHPFFAENNLFCQQSAIAICCVLAEAVKMVKRVLLGALFAVVLCHMLARGTSANLQYPTNSTLEDLLCNSGILPGITTITLLPNVNYTIQPGKACLVDNLLGPLTIRGTSEENLAQIYCIHA